MEHRCVLVNSKTTHIKSYSELYDTVNRGLKKLKLQVGEDFTSLLKRKVNCTYTAVSTENLYYTPRERFNVYFSLTECFMKRHLHSSQLLLRACLALPE
jgi:hypothetical protein